MDPLGRAEVGWSGDEILWRWPMGCSVVRSGKVERVPTVDRSKLQEVARILGIADPDTIEGIDLHITPDGTQDTQMVPP